MRMTRAHESDSDVIEMLDAPDLVPLAKAVLCMDCEQISKQASKHACAGCGSTVLLNLALVLNPELSRG